MIISVDLDFSRVVGEGFFALGFGKGGGVLLRFLGAFGERDSRGEEGDLPTSLWFSDKDGVGGLGTFWMSSALEDSEIRNVRA